MRNDLTPAFIEQMNATSNSPRVLVEFHFTSGIRYLSDQPIGVDNGLSVDYEPIIEDWGSLRDNVRIEPIVAGDSLETRQLTFSIINSSDPRFSKSFANENPENVKVYIYQWFDGLTEQDKALIDVFVCQDPITVNEVDTLVKIQLVSPIMVSNNYIYGPNKTVDVRFPLVVGKDTLVANYYGDSPLCQLASEITYDYVGKLYIEGDFHFPTTGTIQIDTEQMTYDSVTPTGFNVTQRGVNGTTARPHLVGSVINNPEDVYDYEICSGPVDSIDNLVGDSLPYGNTYAVFNGVDPAYIRFYGRPPWHEVEQGEDGPPITPPQGTTSQYGLSTETYTYHGATVSGATNVNSSSGYAILSCDNTVTNYSSTTRYAATYGYTTLQYAYYPENINKNGKDWDVRATANRNVSGDWFGTVAAIGAVQNITSYFNQDLSSLGSFVSCTITVPNLVFTARGYYATCEVILHISGSASTILTTNIGNNNPCSSTGEGWEDSITISGKIKSWVELQSAVLEFKITCTNRNLSPSGCTGSWTFKINGDDGVKWAVSYLPSGTGYVYPEAELVSDFNRDLSHLGELIDVSAQLLFDGTATSPTQSVQSIVYRETSTQSNNTTLWSRAINSTSHGSATVTVFPPINSWDELREARLGVNHAVVGPTSPGTRQRITTNFSYVLWKITYQAPDIPTPNGERVVYVQELLCDVTGQGGVDRTPPEVARTLLDRIGELAEYIDNDVFDEVSQQYIDGDYYFNGLIDGATRFHDALKDVLRQGFLRIIYNAGKIKIVSTYFNTFLPSNLAVREDSNEVDKYVTKDQLRIRAIKEERMRMSEVINRVTIQYDPNEDFTEWLGEVDKLDEDSIDSIGEQRSSLQFPLIKDETIADGIADKILERVGEPRTFTTFTTYINAFDVEKNDIVLIETDFNDYYAVVGNVITSNRLFGSGKSNRMNVHEITMVSQPAKVIDILANDSIAITEHFSYEIGQVVPTEIEDSVAITEDFSTRVFVTHELNISDTVLVSEVVTPVSTEGVYVAVTDDISLTDFSTMGTEFALIDIKETVSVGSFMAQIEILHGYGGGGYGFGGYGGNDSEAEVFYKDAQVIFNGDVVTFKKLGE